MKKILTMAFSSLMIAAQAQWAANVPLNSTNLVTGGNVGIGTGTPSAKLDVTGNTSSYVGADISITRSSTSADVGKGATLQFNDPGSQSYNIIQGSPSGLQFYNSYSAGGTWTERMRITGNGNLGIGTTTPTAKVDISGNGITGLNVLGNNSSYVGPDINITRSSTSADIGKGVVLQFNDPGSLSYNIIQGSTSGLQFCNSYNAGGTWSERMRITGNGNVGIGTTDPGSFKLAVEGKIGAREVNVLAGPGWPDYVFENNYNLPSLEELNTYIKVNKHLPEVPAACAMEENGINLSEMNMLLLKKVEELTLYVIEQNNKLIDQQKINRIQSQRIDKLETQINK